MIDCTNSLEVCNCPCHRKDDTGMEVSHVMPCCETCTVCLANIKTGMMHSHMQKHEKSKDKIY